MITTQREVRKAFWAAHPTIARRMTRRDGFRVLAPHNQQPTDTRAAFVEFVDALARNGEISESLAQRVTL